MIVALDMRDYRLAIVPAFTFFNVLGMSWILVRGKRGPRLPQRVAAGAHFLFGLTQLGAALVALYGGSDISPGVMRVYHLTNFLFMPALYVAMGVSVILLLATDLSWQLRIQALTDQLIGLKNRRGFLAAGERMLARAERTGKPISIILFDAGHFKQVNDTYGHSAGDEALKRIGSVISSVVRLGDKSGRRYDQSRRCRPGSCARSPAIRPLFGIERFPFA